jgi:hypothetical protein
MAAYTRTYGVEIEAVLPRGLSPERLCQAIIDAGLPCYVEPRLTHGIPGKWKITTDSSTGSYGREIVSPILSGDAGLREIDTVCRIAKERGLKITPQCGLHVHVDAKRPVTLDLAALKRATMLYAENELFLDMTQPPSRRGNAPTFCQPLANVNARLVEQSRDLNDLMTVIRYNRMPHPHERFQHYGIEHNDHRRYVKLNLCSFAYRGTIEFRHMAGSIESEKIRAWIDMCQWFVERALNPGSTSAAQVEQTQVLTRAAREGTINQAIYNLLIGPGATMREALDVTERFGTRWKAINMPRAGKNYGLVMTASVAYENGRKVKRYHGRLPTGTVAVVTNSPKPTNIREFCEYLGMAPEHTEYLVKRDAMFRHGRVPGTTREE